MEITSDSEVAQVEARLDELREKRARARQAYERVPRDYSVVFRLTEEMAALLEALAAYTSERPPKVGYRPLDGRQRVIDLGVPVHVIAHEAYFDGMPLGEREAFDGTVVQLIDDKTVSVRNEQGICTKCPSKFVEVK